jgi:hypothetical protein
LPAIGKMNLNDITLSKRNPILYSAGCMITFILNYRR